MSVYTNFKKTDKKHRDGHYLYDAECKVCHRVVRGRKQDLCARVVCKHVYKGTDVSIMPFRNRKAANVFYHIMERCYDTSNKDYPRYGGRGIGVCDEWLHQDGAFETWY